jgi:hypothetical protein
MSGCSSVVERDLAKVDVARSNRVTRFKKKTQTPRIVGFEFFFILIIRREDFGVKGESGIRTHGNRKVSSDFKSDALDQLCHLS